MNFRKPAAALAAVTLSFGLTACGGGQSVDDACTVAEKEVKAAMGDLGNLNPTDTDAATATVTSMTEALAKTEKKLDNTEVKNAIGDLAAEFTKLQTTFTDLKAAGTGADADADKLQKVSTQIQAVSKDIQAKGEALDKLCK